MNNNINIQKLNPTNTNSADSTITVLMNSLTNTQRAINAMDKMSNSLSIVTEKYIDSLAKNNESNEALKDINDVINENYSDDIELKILIEKALNKNSSSNHCQYIQNLHELGMLSSVIANGIKEYDGDMNIYYNFKNKLNDLGLI